MTESRPTPASSLKPAVSERSYSEILDQLANITPQDREKYAESAQRVSRYYDSRPESKNQVSVDALPWELFPIIDKHKFMVITPALATEMAVMLCTAFETWSHSVPNAAERYLTERVVGMGRICLILQAMDKRIFLQNFDAIGKTDLSLPFSKDELEPILEDETVREEFFAHQRIATARDLTLGIHSSFLTDELAPLRHLENLGKGAFGSVDSVENVFTGEVYARKIFRTRKRDAKVIFEREISTLQKLQSHHHIVQLVASYAHRTVMALLLLPVAESNLDELISNFAISQDRAGIRQILYRCFGCLASGLAFMHSQQIRHKDIKPQNILVHESNVLLTDFGLAFDFSDVGASTTYGRPEGWTKKYCAPEVATYGKRGRKSDVFSLGRVFLEVAIILGGENLEDFEESLFNDRPFYENLTKVFQWIRVLENHSGTTLPLHTCRQMLQAESKDRPYMDEVLDSLFQEHHTENTSDAYFCGVCLEQLETPSPRDVSGRTVPNRFGEETTLNDPAGISDIPQGDSSATPNDNPREGYSTPAPAAPRPISPPLRGCSPRRLPEEDMVEPKPIRFNDAIGRRFSLPFSASRTWLGMEFFIKEAFLHDETIGPKVAKGFYDLVGPSGEIILPQVWEEIVEPDWSVTMHMWPTAEQPPPQPPPPPPKIPPPPPSSSYSLPPPIIPNTPFLFSSRLLPPPLPLPPMLVPLPPPKIPTPPPPPSSYSFPPPIIPNTPFLFSSRSPPPPLPLPPMLVPPPSLPTQRSAKKKATKLPPPLLMWTAWKSARRKK
ncbi:MAG: hypothetical protein M1813_007479 [Trichoglossum hirsutum]|nr:MAG: hypothetical protein M1813_007479 [Trichoglossum hirsutum]